MDLLTINRGHIMIFCTKKVSYFLAFILMSLYVNNFCYALTPEYHIGNHVYTDIRPVDSSLYKKHILFLGSSVTRGYASFGVSFVDLLERKYGIVPVKEAVDGTTLLNYNDISYFSRLKRIKNEHQFDAVVVQLSTNDATRNFPDLINDSELKITKIKNSIIDIITYIRKTWNCPVIFYTNPYFENKDYKKMVELILKMSREYQFTVVDFYNNKSWNNLSPYEKGLRMYDSIHPTLKGYIDMSEEFARVLQKIIKDKK